MQPYCGELLCVVAGSLQSQIKFIYLKVDKYIYIYDMFQIYYVQ